MKLVVMKKSVSSENRLRRLAERRPSLNSDYSGKLASLMKRRGDAPDGKLKHFRSLILEHLSKLEKRTAKKARRKPCKRRLILLRYWQRAARVCLSGRCANGRAKST
jgi:hypothetical protein